MFLLLLSAIFFPGFFLAVIVARREHVLLLAMPLAVSMYVAIVVIAFKLSVTQWVFPVYLLIGAILTVIVLVRSHYRNKAVSAIALHWVLLPLLIVVVIYQMMVGPFSDFGVDLYRHLRFVNTAVRGMESLSGGLQMKLEPGTLNLVFHNIAAYWVYITGVSSEQLIRTIMFVYPLLWTMTVYLFCHSLLNLMQVPERRLVLWALLATALYWITFGINNFSFPRYYLAGPVILTHAMYLAALVLCLELLRDRLTIRELLLVGVVIAPMTFLHPQELLLLASSLMAILVVVLISAVTKRSAFADIPLTKHSVVISLLGLTMISVCIAAAIYLRPKYAHDPISLLNLGVVHERFAAWNILRPNHQFFTVVGWWGLLMFGLVIVNIRLVKNSAIAMSLLLFPLLTVFNPIYSEAVMKLAYPAVLWRLLFALHLPLLVCYLLWRMKIDWDLSNGAKRSFQLAAVVSLVVLLFPFKLGDFENRMVKWPSLTSTPMENSWQNWESLIDFLNQDTRTRKILSDPVTGYAIRSMTRHLHYGKKFFPIGGYIKINFDDYHDHPLGKYKGWLLVINTKNGEINRRLKPPHHIYPHVMVVDHYYSDILLDEVSQREDRYKLIWQGDRQFVYEIQ